VKICRPACGLLVPHPHHRQPSHPSIYPPNTNHSTTATHMDEALDSMRADATNRGMLAHLSKTEARILYTRNLLLILLSLVVGGRAWLSILPSWRSAALSPVRKFTHFLVSV